MDIAIMSVSILLAFAMPWIIAVLISWKEIKQIKDGLENPMAIEKGENLQNRIELITRLF
jgi:hypothetical protein